MADNVFTKGGSDYVTSKINEAIENRSRTATVSGKWEIDREIRLPSNFTLILRDCHLKMSDGSFSNMFVNEHHDTELGRTVEGRDRNISIIGRGEAIIDGGKYNGLSEKNHSRDGMPPIWKNNLILFTNVEGLVVEDLTIARQRWWAITNIAVRHARFARIKFAAELSRIDEEGVHYPGEWPKRHREMYVKNADGIDLRVGCSDVLIEDISGFTGDDTVALTALGGFERRLGWLPEDLSPDIHDVTVRRVDSETFGCATVRLLNHNGNKLYNVTVEDVTNRHTEGIFRSHAAVSVGDKNYAEQLNAPGDTHCITIKNVRSAAQIGVSLCRYLSDSVIENVTALDGQTALAVRPNTTATLTNCCIRSLHAENGIPFAPDGLTLDGCTVDF